MNSLRNKRAVGTFSSRADVERAIEALRDANFPLDHVSVIARDASRHSDIAGVDVTDRSDTKASEGAVTGAVAGGTLGGVTGLLVGLGALAIPGIGPIVLAGAEATALATTVAGGAIGAAAGGLVGSLAGLGIPEDRARLYSDRVAGGDYLVMVRGTEDEIRRAEVILNQSHIGNFGVYDVSVGSHRDLDRPATAAGTTGERLERTENVVDRPLDEATTTSPNVIIIDRREEQFR